MKSGESLIKINFLDANLISNFGKVLRDNPVNQIRDEDLIKSRSEMCLDNRENSNPHIDVLTFRISINEEPRETSILDGDKVDELNRKQYFKSVSERVYILEIH